MPLLLTNLILKQCQAYAALWLSAAGAGGLVGISLFLKIFLWFLSVWFFNSLGTFRAAGVEVEWLYRLCDRTIALTAVSFFLICLTSVQLQRCSCTGIAQQGTYFVTWCPDSVRNWRTYLVASLFWLYTCRKKGASWSAFHNSVTQQCKKHYGNSNSEVKIKVLILKA